EGHLFGLGLPVDALADRIAAELIGQASLKDDLPRRVHVLPREGGAAGDAAKSFRAPARIPERAGRDNLAGGDEVGDVDAPRREAAAEPERPGVRRAVVHAAHA